MSPAGGTGLFAVAAVADPAGVGVVLTAAEGSWDAGYPLGAGNLLPVACPQAPTATRQSTANVHG
jgi:hypothetical protein